MGKPRKDTLLHQANECRMCAFATITKMMQANPQNYDEQLAVAVRAGPWLDHQTHVEDRMTIGILLSLVVELLHHMDNPQQTWAAFATEFTREIEASLSGLDDSDG